MKVSELKRLLESVPDDMEVLISGGPDHSYSSAKVYDQAVHTVGVRRDSRGHAVVYLEWYGEEIASPNEKPESAFILHRGW